MESGELPIGGAHQGSCRLGHAANGCISSAAVAIATTESRSGLSVTDADRRPVSRLARPAIRVAVPSLDVELVPFREDRLIGACMSLRRYDVADAAVAMIDVVPTHEVCRPGPSYCQIDEALGWELWRVLRGSGQRLGIGVVAADPRPGVRRFDAQPVQHRQHCRRLEPSAVVAVQDGLVGSVAIPSAGSVRRTKFAAWIESSLSCTSQPMIFRL